jgi:phospholipase C
MKENRSFDHYLGWLADDEAYLDAGRRLHGSGFSIDGRVHQTFYDPLGREAATRPAAYYESKEKVETRGCTYGDPGHSWMNGRVQRDHGFLALGSGNDEFALTYYGATNLPVYAALARRFTVFDRWHASLLGPTFPNRQYLYSAQSEGLKTNPGLDKSLKGIVRGIYRAETIVERLGRAGVSTGYYYTNIPLLALWGTDRMAPFIQTLDRYFEDAAAGVLPRVVFLEPFGGSEKYSTDDHPWADVGIGQRWIREVFRAFVESPHWKSGAFIITYDEWGGFFDHVRPPVFADSRESKQDQDNFGQGGFRVPALIASPYARRGAVDHRLYEHTAILRFLQWRFLGAPPKGTGGGRWSLTKRDRNAQNMGATLTTSQPDPSLGFDLSMRIPQPAPECTPEQVATHPKKDSPNPFDRPELIDRMTQAYPRTSHRPWLADVIPPG